jgi:hypothetical protein
MSIKEFNRIFEKEIKKRIDSSEWSCLVVSRVFERIKKERKSRIINVLSAMFPMAAAALLFIVLSFGIGPSNEQGSDLNFGEVIGVDNVLGNAYSLSYDFVDYYVEVYLSQR